VHCRDGLISVTSTESSRLVACCQDLTGTITPLHMLAVNTSTAAAAAHDGSSADAAVSSVAAAAWLDRVLVFAAPWQASSAAVLCSYQCPEVRRAPGKAAAVGDEQQKLCARTVNPYACTERS
jgi:hypothetical protein